MKRIGRGDIAFGLLLAWSAFATFVTLRGQRVVAPSQGVPGTTFVAAWRTFAVRGFARGPIHSPWTVVVFADFQCPYCRRFAPILDSLHARHPEVLVVERHFPIRELHPNAFDAALAAECAGDQGRYEAARAALYEREDLLVAENWPQLAREAGIADVSRLNECIESRTHAVAIEADYKDGLRLGIRGTPSVLVNDSLLGSTPTLAELERRMQSVGRR